jgi:hypothetical protein
MKKEGFKRSLTGFKIPLSLFYTRKSKKAKRKKTSKSFWKFRKDFYLCSPKGNEGKNKTIKRAQCHRNKADTEVEAAKVL